MLHDHQGCLVAMLKRVNWGNFPVVASGNSKRHVLPEIKDGYDGCCTVALCSMILSARHVDFSSSSSLGRSTLILFCLTKVGDGHPMAISNDTPNDDLSTSFPGHHNKTRWRYARTSQEWMHPVIPGAGATCLEPPIDS